MLPEEIIQEVREGEEPWSAGRACGASIRLPGAGRLQDGAGGPVAFLARGVWPRQVVRPAVSSTGKVTIEDEMKEEMKEDVDPHSGADDGRHEAGLADRPLPWPHPTRTQKLPRHP